MRQNQDFVLDFHATAPLGGEAACRDDLCVTGGEAKKKGWGPAWRKCLGGPAGTGEELAKRTFTLAGARAGGLCQPAADGGWPGSPRAGTVSPGVGLSSWASWGQAGGCTQQGAEGTGQIVACLWVPGNARAKDLLLLGSWVAAPRVQAGRDARIAAEPFLLGAIATARCTHGAHKVVSKPLPLQEGFSRGSCKEQRQ